MCTPKTSALSSYMCGRNSPNFTSVMTSTIEGCDIPLKNPETEKVYLQLLQHLAYRKVEFFNCKVLVHRVIKYCGAFSHNKIVAGGDSRYVHTLSKEACVDAIKYSKIKFESITIRDLIVNTTSRRTLTVAGELTTDGTCYGTKYNTKSAQYDGVVVTADLKIILSTGAASFDERLNRVIMPDNLVCSYRAGTCMDVSETSYYWNPTSSGNFCNFDQYAILYEGESTRVRDREGAGPTIYFTNTSSSIQFGLEKRSEVELCGYTLIATEHARLFLLETRPNAGLAAKQVLDAENIILSAYFKTKLAYFTYHVKTQFDALYRDSIFQKCMIARQIISNALSRSDSHPDIFALAVMKKRGFSAILAGETAHLVSCMEVACQIRAAETCFNELPVVCKGAEGFLKPNTRIFTRVGTPRECSVIFPEIFEVDEVFIAMNPNVTLVQKPSIIQPLEAPTWNYEEIRSFMSSGIYSAEELEKLEDHMGFPLKRQALLESVVRRLADRPCTAESGNFQKLLDKDTFNKMSRSYFRSLYPGFIEFGAVCAGIAGCVVIIQLIKLVIDTVIHGVTLYSIYGWSFRLLGAFFGSITTMLIHIGRPPANNENNNNNDNDNNDIDRIPNGGNQLATPSALAIPPRNLQNVQNANHTTLRSSLNAVGNSTERVIDIENSVLNSAYARAAK
ncbi:hypothetical protein TKK_0018664 [Trichogramma kaykai]